MPDGLSAMAKAMRGFPPETTAIVLALNCDMRGNRRLTSFSISAGDDVVKKHDLGALRVIITDVIFDG